MKTLATARSDRLFRTAAWFYITPRLVGVSIILGAVALAVFLVLTQLARTWLLSLDS